MVRIDVYAMAGLEEMCCAFCWRRQRADEGRRKDGGSKPQLRGALGGIVVVVLLRWRCGAGLFAADILRFRPEAQIQCTGHAAHV